MQKYLESKNMCLAMPFQELSDEEFCEVISHASEIQKGPHIKSRNVVGTIITNLKKENTALRESLDSEEQHHQCKLTISKLENENSLMKDLCKKGIFHGAKIQQESLE